MTRSIAEILSDAERLRAYRERQRRALERRRQTIALHGGELGRAQSTCPSVRMVVTPWATDAAGNRWREVRGE